MNEQDQENLSQLFHACGRITWLWSQSGLHKSWPVGLQTRFMLPAVMHKQFYILEKNGVPQAYCSWAWLTLKTEAKFVVDPNTLNADDWIAGDRLWFIDWIAPFHARHTRQLRAKMAEKFPNEVARAIRVKPGQSQSRVATFAGGDLTREQARDIRAKLYRDLGSGPINPTSLV